MIVKVNIPIFDLRIRFANDREEAIQEAREISEGEDDGDDLDHLAGCAYPVDRPDGARTWIMCVFDGKINTVVHEAVHTARMVLDHLGIPWSKTHDEALAYMTAWLVDEYLEKVGLDS